MIPYGRQDVTQSDIDAVVDVLRSDFLTQGPLIPKFESLISKHVGAKFAVAVNSGTSALHIACLALELGKGDRLWTVPNTFVASANCALYCGAEVDFVDIDPETWNLSVPCLRDKLVAAKKEDRLPKVVVPVHFAGLPTEQEAIWELAREFGFKVLEDASHAIGARRNDEPVGSCRWSDITVLSFHPVKVITSGEGGMALTNDERVATSMTLLRSHGVTRDPNRFEVSEAEANGKGPPSGSPGGWHYEQHLLGFNYRMTDVHAALGTSQLNRLEAYIGRRNELAQRYNVAFRDLPIQLPSIAAGDISAFHLYVIRLQADAKTGERRRVYDALRKRGIGVNVHYTPVHLQPYYRALGFSPGQFPRAEAHGELAITLPLYSALTDQQQDDVIRAVKDVL